MMQSTLSTKGRIAFIDALRGLAIVLMALDHVRDFFGPTTFNPVDLNATTPLWFLTRYITHFCAPVFVFLAGVGAALYGQTVSRGILARFLVTRGIWLVFLECTWVSLSWGVLPVSYTHLRAHETVLDLVCRLLLEKKTHSQKSSTTLSPIIKEANVG